MGLAPPASSILERTFAMHADVRTTLRTAVTRLDPSDRLLVLLHYADGLNLDEIATVLDAAPADVARRMDALRWRLARIVQDADVQADPQATAVTPATRAAAATA
jgi:DNA-directed RNA polymerase specialized sigma24 family protein